MQRICLIVLSVAIIAVGCSERRAGRRVEVDNTPRDRVVQDGPVKDDPIKDKNGKGSDPLQPVKNPPKDEVLAKLPELTTEEKYEAALARATDLVAEQKYEKALEVLTEAQKLKDTGAVQREIYRIEAILAGREAASKALADVKAILQDGKPEEAARLATEALGQFGGSDVAEALARLQQQAEAELNAAITTAATKAQRVNQLRRSAAEALREEIPNLRAATVALEQAQALEPTEEMARQLDDLREKLRIYDENRQRAQALRRDPLRLPEAIEALETSRKVWPTVQVRQELDEFRLLQARRRDRLSVAPFEIRADLGFPAAGQTIADELLPHFKARFDLVERAQLARLADEMKLESNAFFDNTEDRRELGRLAKIRYLVVGSVSPLGGITVQARLVEVETGLIVQTGRITAANLDELLPRLKQLAVLLQMSDEQKAAYEAEIQRTIRPVETVSAQAVNWNELPPPPPPPPEEAIVAAPPVVTISPAPIARGGIVLEDFNRLPPLVLTPLAPPSPPPVLAVALEAYPERRNRLLRLSLELGDRLFRRGRIRDAQRHFSLALSLAGPRREIELRLDACRGLVAPIAPPVVVVPPPVVVSPPPVVIGPPPVVVAPPPPVVIVAPVRPRMAIFGFVPGRADLVPPATTDLLAEQLAWYMGGSYEIIDRGEVSWYMGRLGLTMREVLTDPVARRCLAQALNARFFVFGTLRETASFDVDTHLFDAETNQRTGTASIHVKDTNELKLRLGELARQLGAKPDEKKVLAANGAQSEKYLNEARAALTKADYATALATANEGLKRMPDSVALRSLAAQARTQLDRANAEAARAAEARKQAAALEAARKKQQELALAAAEARAKAEAAAKARSEAEKKAQEDRRVKAAQSLRAQAQAASAKGNHSEAVRLLQSATALHPSDALFKELAQARAAEAEQKKAASEAAQKAAAEKAAKERAEAQARLEEARKKREAAEKAAREAKHAQDKITSDALLKQAQDAFANKEFAKAIELANSSRRVLANPQAEKLARDAQNELALAKASAAERAKLAEEQKKREAAEAEIRKNREAYTKALTLAHKLVQDGKLDQAEKEYLAAQKLFKTPEVQEGLRAVSVLRKQRAAAEEAAKKAKEAEAQRETRLKSLLATASAAAKKGEFANAVKAYREANTLKPNDVEILSGLSRAEADLQRQQEAQARAEELKKAKAAAAALITQGKQRLAAKQPKEAAELFRRALIQDASNAEARSLLAQAEKQMPPLVDPAAKKRKEDFDLAMSAGQAALKKGNYTGAINAFREALRLLPDDASATKALADAQRAEKTAWYNNAMQRGAEALKAKRFKEAFEAYDEALKSRPGDAKAIEGKRAAQMGLMPPKPEPLPKPDPKKQAHDKALAAALQALKAGQRAEALKQVNAALAALPDSTQAATLKAEIERQMNEAQYAAFMKQAAEAMTKKQYRNAIVAYDEALKRKPKDPEASKGRAAAEAALKMPPPKPDPMPKPKPDPLPNPKVDPKPKPPELPADYIKDLTQAETLEKAKQYAKALPLYQSALQRVANDGGQSAAQARAWAGIGRSHHFLKQYAEAVRAYEEVLKRRPDDNAIKDALNRAKMKK
ncbi:MAG: tetratricopeptide repeat protein [Gemmataceae bacterium]